MAASNSRVYYPIWEALKKNHAAKISADPALHRRIIKAVIKEKDMDLAFKKSCRIVGIKYKLFYSTPPDSDTIIFTLEKSYLSLLELLQ